MRESWRPLALAAAFIATMAAGPASAQTVSVTKASPGASIQVVLNTTPVGTATADEKGIASLAVDLQKLHGKTETDVRIFVDICGQARRVTLVEPGYQPDQPAAVCARHEIFGMFYLRPVTTLVVNVSEETQGVWISQGPAPPAWFGNEVAGGSAEKTGSALYVPNGLHVFAGGGFDKFSNAVSVSCGVGTECVGKGTRLAGQVGANYWITSNLAIAGFYLRGINPATAGAGVGYNFNSSLATNVAVVTGKAGVPLGKMRLYVQGGITYTWATLTTTETIAGATATFIHATRGLGWTVSGGSEVLVATEGGALRGVRAGHAEGVDRGRRRGQPRRRGAVRGCRVQVPPRRVEVALGPT